MRSSKSNILFVSLISFTLLLQSCYSVTLVSKTGSGVANPLNKEIGIFTGKDVVEINKTVKTKIIVKELGIFEKCDGDGFFAVQYRVTLGSVLLNAITFGTRRKVRIRYVCLKQIN